MAGIVVYGQLNDIELMFIRLADAKYYSSIHTAHNEGISYGELCKRHPGLFEDVMEYYNRIHDFSVSLPNANCDRYFEELETAFFEGYGRDPDMIERAEDFYEIVSDEDGDKEFSENGFKDFYENELVELDERLPLKDEIFSLDHHSLFYEILNSEPRMNWVPDAIGSKYGKVMETMRDGNIFRFSPEDEEKIVTAFESLGYQCVKDEEMIRRAYGDS